MAMHFLYCLLVKQLLNTKLRYVSGMCEIGVCGETLTLYIFAAPPLFSFPTVVQMLRAK